MTKSIKEDQPHRPHLEPGEVPSCELYDAVLEKDWMGLLKTLKTAPSDAAYLDKNWESPLSLACQFRPPIRVVKALVEAYPPATKQVSRRHKDLPIHIACRHQANLQVLEELCMAAPEALLHRTEYGSTVLTALWEGYESVGRTANYSYQSTFWEKVDFILQAMARERQRLAFSAIGKRNVLQESTTTKLFCLHAAVSMGSQGCPVEILEFCLHRYRDQVWEEDAQGCLPCHVALGGGTSKAWEVRASKHYRRSRRRRRLYLKYKTVHGQPELTVLTRLLQIHPEAALMEHQHQLPLHMALKQGHSWKEGVRELWQTSPNVLSVVDPFTNLYAFQLAALRMEDEVEEDSDLDTVFRLLRNQPSVLIPAVGMASGFAYDGDSTSTTTSKAPTTVRPPRRSKRNAKKESSPQTRYQMVNRTDSGRKRRPSLDDELHLRVTPKRSLSQDDHIKNKQQDQQQSFLCLSALSAAVATTPVVPKLRIPRKIDIV